MRDLLRRHAVTIAVAFVTAVVAAGGPAVAGAVYDALNADKVDGFHAVGAGNTARKGKLVATDRDTGRLPNNIIAKPAAAGTADRVRSLAGLAGQPCTRFGQTGTLRAVYTGIEDPTVTLECAGIVGLDEYDADDTNPSNDTRGNATLRILPGPTGSIGWVSISPATDVDWYTIAPPCDASHMPTVTLSGARDGAGIVMSLYRNDDTQPISGPVELLAGDELFIKVTATQATKYGISIAGWCP